MSIERVTSYGNINISQEAIATLAGGVVGMASQKLVKDGWAELLKKENYSRGVVVRKTERGMELDLYIVIGFGVKVSEVVSEVQKKVKYVLEKTLEQDFAAVNVYVQGVRVIG